MGGNSPLPLSHGDSAVGFCTVLINLMLFPVLPCPVMVYCQVQLRNLVRCNNKHTLQKHMVFCSAQVPGFYRHTGCLPVSHRGATGACSTITGTKFLKACNITSRLHNHSTLINVCLITLCHISETAVSVESQGCMSPKGCAATSCVKAFETTTRLIPKSRFSCKLALP